MVFLIKPSMRMNAVRGSESQDTILGYVSNQYKWCGDAHIVNTNMGIMQFIIDIYYFPC